MNIFLIAFRVGDLHSDRMHAELRKMTSIYPSLDGRTVFSHGAAGGGARIAMISSSRKSLLPRQYFDRTANGATFYCGLPIDPDGVCEAHDASSLARHWDAVRGRLEGTYVIVRARDDAGTLEIQTDLLGGEAVYYVRHNGGWLISNSVLLLERMTMLRALDSLGVSLYLSLGQVLGDRTLREDIRLIPGSQHWKWHESDREPKRHCYYPLSNLAAFPRNGLDAQQIAALAERLQRPLSRLSAGFDSVVCPLTGGRDSRLIAALLMNAGLDATYFTFGEPEGGDARVARHIADTFGLQHKFIEVDKDDVKKNWERYCLPSIRSTDGMRSLFLLGGMSKSSPVSGAGRDVYLWGACGEVGRSFFGDLPYLKRDISPEDIKDRLEVLGVNDSLNLTSDSVKSRARAWKNNRVDEIAAAGIPPLDIPGIVGNHIVDARRLSNNGRALAASRDTYTPYASKAFLEAAFSYSALQRYTEPLHYRLTRLLVPELHRMPFSGIGWHSQNPAINLVRKRLARKTKSLKWKMQSRLNRIGLAKPVFQYQDSMFERLTWFENRREHIRTMALDNATSSIWEYVNKARFEQVTSADTAPIDRSRNLKLLYHIVTLLYYESDTDRQPAAK